MATTAAALPRDHTQDYVVDDDDPAVTRDAAVKEETKQTETDAHRLAQRQKQVDFGKNTLGYQMYLRQVPKEHRRKRAGDPMTPDINQAVSKKCFDGQIRVWRRVLHKYDEEAKTEQGNGVVASRGGEADNKKRVFNSAFDRKGRENSSSNPPPPSPGKRSSKRSNSSSKHGGGGGEGRRSDLAPCNASNTAPEDDVFALCMADAGGSDDDGLGDVRL